MKFECLRSHMYFICGYVLNCVSIYHLVQIWTYITFNLMEYLPASWANVVRNSVRVVPSVFM